MWKISSNLHLIHLVLVIITGMIAARSSLSYHDFRSVVQDKENYCSVLEAKVPN